MGSKNNGEPAFPFQPVTPIGEPYSPAFGLSIRDYFAAKAMQGIIGAPKLDASDWPKEWAGKSVGECVAIAAYQYADEMLRARGVDNG